MDFKVAAREVLGEVGHPLHYTDIIEIALESGYLESAGRTPHNTMRARLSVDVRDKPGHALRPDRPRHLRPEGRRALSLRKMLYSGE